MKYYSEEDLIEVIESNTSLNGRALLSLVRPATLPTLESTSSDRERIRMELWKDVFTQSLRNDDMSMRDSEDEAQLSVEAFDKQFPK
jgi:hypothetical protein